MTLHIHYTENTEISEIGVDEAGRGPLFGRVYAAAVILPKETTNEEAEYDFTNMKDSKKFSSKKKIKEVADYIKENSISWAVAFEDEKTIDKINILQATQSAMHKAIRVCLEKAQTEKKALQGGSNCHLLVDASILAKVSRDEYIEEICDENPWIDELYGIRSNKGYGAKKHMTAVREHGASKWHRRSFAPCKNVDIIDNYQTD
jgi:ribonuclease HII